MTAAEPEALWHAYRDEGKTIRTICEETGKGYGTVISILQTMSGYSQLAAERQRAAPSLARAQARKSIDTDRALREMEAGKSAREVSRMLGVSHRTLIKRLETCPRYRRIVERRFGAAA